MFAVALFAGGAAAQSRHRAAGAIGPFNPARFTAHTELEGALLWARASSSNRADRGVEVSFGSGSFTLHPPPFLLSGTASLVVRSLALDSYSVSLPRHTIVGGLHLGPLEPFGGFGFSLFTVDVLHGDFSVGLLSPLSTAGVALRMGHVRLQTHATAEYLWRWFGDDYWVRSVGLSVSLGETPRARE